MQKNLKWKRYLKNIWRFCYDKKRNELKSKNK